MIVLYIIFTVLFLIGILLSLSVAAHIEYRDDFSVKVKYLFITLYNSRKSKKPKSKKSKNKKKKQTLTEKISKDSGIDAIMKDVKEGNKRGFDFEMLKLMYDAAKNPVKRLIQKLRVVNLKFNCVVGGEDAAKIALNYGFQSAAISGGLSWLNEIVTLKIKNVDITADFEKEKTDIRMKCKIKLSVISAVAFFVRYLINSAKNK